MDLVLTLSKVSNALLASIMQRAESFLTGSQNGGANWRSLESQEGSSGSFLGLRLALGFLRTC